MSKRQLLAILVSWGTAVLIIASLLYWRVQANDRDQDRATCELTEVFLGDPEPVAGPAGDRSRAVRAAMAGYRDAFHCSRFQEG